MTGTVPSERQRERPRSRPAQANRNRWVRTRIFVASGLLTAFLLGIGYKAYGIQIADADHYRELARRQHMRTLEIPAPRGVIYDARGRELAVSVDADSVFAVASAIQDVTGTAEALSQVLGIDVRVLEDKLADPRHFVWIDRHVIPERARAVAALNLTGIELAAEPRRFYPGSAIGGPVLGFANIDGKGIEGIERAMNELLTGRQGELPVLRDARGRVMMSESETGVIPGASVHLTLDRTVQHFTETALASAITEHDAVAGTAVVLEVGTGRVLAMASMPTYDPNRPAGAVAANARNRAVTDAYEIGSPMKIFTVAAALEAGVIRPDQVIDTENGRFRVGRKMIVDSHRDPELDITGIIRRSSNVGAVKIAQALGREALHDALVRYGFGAKTSIELPGERSGLVRPAKRWGEIGLATASFGYGMTVTPLQLAAAFSAIVNHGVFVEPRMVAEVRDAAGDTLFQHQPAGRQMLRADVADRVRAMSASVFDQGRRGGTARDIHVPGYRAGGKTGTAHKIDPTTGRYGDHLYLSSFVGAAPIDDPRIVVVVVIDEPRGKEYYGAKVAGPAFAEITSQTLRYLGVPLDAPLEPEIDEPAAGKDSKAGAEPASKPADAPVALGDDMPATDVLTEAIDGVRVPSFAGLSIARALELAHDQGISLEVVGSGVAVSQTPEAGVPSRDAACRVVFSPGY